VKLSVKASSSFFQIKKQLQNGSGESWGVSASILGGTINVGSDQIIGQLELITEHEGDVKSWQRCIRKRQPKRSDKTIKREALSTVSGVMDKRMDDGELQKHKGKRKGLRKKK